MKKLDIKKISTFTTYFVAWFLALLIIFKSETFKEIATNLKARSGILEIHLRRVFVPFLLWKLFLAVMLIITYKNAPVNSELYTRGIYLWFFFLADIAIGLIMINGLIPKPTDGKVSVIKNATRGLLGAAFLVFAIVAVVASVFLPVTFSIVDKCFLWFNILILLGLLSAIKGMPVSYATYRNITLLLTVAAIVFFAFLRGTMVGSGLATFRSATNARLTSTLEKLAARQNLGKVLNYAEKKRGDADIKNNETRPKFTVLCSVVAVDSSGASAGLLKSGEFIYMDFDDSLKYGGVEHYAIYRSNPISKVGYVDPGDDCLKPGWDEKLAATVIASDSLQQYLAIASNQLPPLNVTWSAGTIVTLQNPNSKNFRINTSSGEEFHVMSSERTKVIQIGYQSSWFIPTAEAGTQLIWIDQQAFAKNQKNVEVI